jgi:RNA polymerase sigma-70 factor, ECF subfamily
MRSGPRGADTGAASPRRAASVNAAGLTPGTAPGPAAPRAPGLDEASREWIDSLRAEGPRRQAACARLRELLVSAARFEARRRATAASLSLSAEELEEVAQQSAHDALLSILAKLDSFRGASRFTTWAYKFAILEAGVAIRRRAWRGREVVLCPEEWTGLPAARTADDVAETGELLRRVTTAINAELTPHQREVLIALTVDGVPLDVLAERLATTRGALYKSLHDARRKLRSALAAEGLLEEPR